MLRQQISEALKSAMKEKNSRALSTLRLILAAIKDRDISVRAKGNQNGVNDSELLSIFQSMIKQRRESINLYEKGGRNELAKQELEEISIIEEFLPVQLTEEEESIAINDIIQETGTKSIKEMGRIMNVLKDKFPGRMDFARTSRIVRERLE
mgnify:CR=1 FL=1